MSERLAFLRTGMFFVGGLVHELNAAPELWDLITLRQEYPGSAHKDTRCIFLRWPPNAADSWNDVPTVDMPWLDKLPAAAALMKQIEDWNSARVVRALIAELKPGGHITPHVDEGEHAAATDRIHVVLRSDIGNVFRCGDECLTAGVGESFYFDHRREHEVWNHSSGVRWHLILDVKPA